MSNNPDLGLFETRIEGFLEDWLWLFDLDFSDPINQRLANAIREEFLLRNNDERPAYAQYTIRPAAFYGGRLVLDVTQVDQSDQSTVISFIIDRTDAGTPTLVPEDVTKDEICDRTRFLEGHSWKDTLTLYTAAAKRSGSRN